MAGEDAAYLLWVRRQPCSRCASPPPSEAHHTGRKGTGQRSHDELAIPLCGQCHRERHSLSGRFKDETKPTIRVWEALVVVRSRTAWERNHQGSFF